MTASKPIHTIVLDAGPMLKNHPPISSLQAKAERLVTVPAVISEIKDAAARSRVETTWMPFLEIVSPNDQSIKIITNFATRTGDLAVLSRPDVEILALTYQLEEQRNGLSYIRTSPAQQLQKGERPERRRGDIHGSRSTADTAILSDPDAQRNFEEPDARKQDGGALKASEPSVAIDIDKLSETTNALQISDDAHKQQPEHVQAGEPSKVQDTQPESDDSDSESDGWITSSNIQRHQAKEHNATVPVSAAKPIDVACITSDFAMQNVLLSMNLDLLNPSFERIRNIKTFILRCHGCFEKTKDMKKQFCPRCGKPTLTRVSCSTNSKGEFKMHLKKNMQWNHRGDRYSIPKPVSGSANGKAGQGKGGGKGGWGQNLILAEDQKEFLRATGGSRRKKETDPMNEAYLPSILTGDRGRAGGRPKIGAGRNVNSKKR
ncbi:MAG: hypothetical protein LQ338_004717 [Usnochroma carphineum]|nr:MAG: hypothetical protein LQ338_004717 [Usnochroma carphineum]